MKIEKIAGEYYRIELGPFVIRLGEKGGKRLRLTRGGSGLRYWLRIGPLDVRV